MFAIAFVCAGIAAFLMRGLLSKPEPQVVAVVSQPSVAQVVVAARDIKPGEKLNADAVREVAWPPDSVPKGAFLSKDALFNGSAERQVAVALAQNEPVLQTKLFGSSNSMLSGRLSEGMSGVTIRVSDTGAVGGFVQPEDKVDVLMTQADRVSEGSASGKAYTITLLRNVRVLAVDQQTLRRPQAQPPKTVTLEVTADDAKKLTLGGAIGQLSLTLNPGGAWNSVDSGIIDINDLLRIQPQKPVSATPIDIDPVVTVTRLVDRKDYKVPDEVRR